MQHFRNATSGRVFVNMWLNNCERKLPFASVSLSYCRLQMFFRVYF